MDQQIAAVRAALSAVESAIAQTEAALATAANPGDVVALRSVLVDLKAERAKLQFQLVNLEAAAVEVTPLARPGIRARVAPARAAPVSGGRRLSAADRARLKTLQRELTSAVTDRSVSVAALAFAKKVMTRARSVGALGAGSSGSATEGGSRKRSRAGAAKRPAARRRSTDR